MSFNADIGVNGVQQWEGEKEIAWKYKTTN